MKKEGAIFISSAAYGAYIPLTRPTHFCPLAHHFFNFQYPEGIQEHWIQDSKGFLPISMGLNHLAKKNSSIYHIP